MMNTAEVATNATAVMDGSAWIAGVAAAIALAALYFTWRQADAAKRQTDLQEKVHRDSAQPYVWADFRLDAAQGSLLRLVVRNEGPTVAENVRIVFEPPLQGADNMPKDLSSVHEQLSKGLRSMPPGREMVWPIGVGHRLYADDSNVTRKYTVTITGRGPFGDLPPLIYPLDLDELQGIHAPRLGSLDDIAKAIIKLGKRPG